MTCCFLQWSCSLEVRLGCGTTECGSKAINPIVSGIGEEYSSAVYLPPLTVAIGFMQRQDRTMLLVMLCIDHHGTGV